METDDMNDDARDSSGSRGSRGEPVGWQATDEYGLPYGYMSWKDGEDRWPKSQTVPVYLHPQPTLTDAEQQAVRYMIAAAKFGQRDEALTEEHAATLRKLLERLD